MEFVREMWEVQAFLCFLRFAVFQSTVGSALLWQIQLSLPWENTQPHFSFVCWDTRAAEQILVCVTLVPASPSYQPGCCCGRCCTDTALIVTWPFPDCCVTSHETFPFLYQAECVGGWSLFGIRQGYREISSGQGPAMPNLGLGVPWAASPVHVISGFESVRGMGVQTHTCGPPVSSWLGLSSCTFSMDAFLVASQTPHSLFPL